MRKRSISIILALCLVLSLLPYSAFAEETELREDGVEAENVSGETEDISGGTEDDSTKTEPLEPEDPVIDGSAAEPETDGGPAEPEEDADVSDTPSGAGDGAAPTAADTPVSGSCGWNLTWSFSDGTLTIQGPAQGSASMSGSPDINYWPRPWEDIRNQVQTLIIGSGVPNIGQNAFRLFENLTSVSISSSVTTIEEGAFSWCTSLPSVNIPDSVTSIGNSAFSGCSSLTSVSIPNSVTTIGYDIFSSCVGLTSVSLPNSITSAIDRTFDGCSSLTSVNIPDRVTTIGYRAFAGCSSLTSVSIPSSVTSIVSYAFSECSSLTSVNIPSGVTSIGDYAFDTCSRLASVSIPGSVTSIGKGAFRKCVSLTSVVIPNGVTTIGKEAFYDCTNLASVTASASIRTVHKSSFQSTKWYASMGDFPVINKILLSYEGKDSVVNIPNGVATIGNQAFYGCSSSLTSVNIPNTVISIGDEAFRECSNLPSVTIPNSVTSIGDSAFWGCGSLNNLNIPDSVTTIGEAAFYACSSLTSVNIPNGVTSIEVLAFSGCSSLTSVTIPSSVTSIGNSAFSGCSSLTGVTIPSSVTSIGEYAFSGCSSLTSVTIPGRVTAIGFQAFSRCSSLTSVTIPDSVTSIGHSTFSGCSSLTSVNLPNRVTAIESYVFYGCSSLTSVNIPSSVTSIGDNAFSGCSSLTSVTIPGRVTAIGFQAFSGCSSLTSVNIPDSVTSIWNSAFSGCGKLRDVYFKGTQDQWEKITIDSGNEPLQNAKKHYAFAVPDSDDREWVYVQNLTKNSLAKADEETKSLLNIAIYNLLFKAYYRPFKSDISKDLIPNKPSFGGQKALDIMKTWPLQNNCTLPTDDRRQVTDPVLGPCYYRHAAEGCMSYALFASAYTYGTIGTAVVCPDKSAAGIKEFFRKCLDPGEQIRYVETKNPKKGKMHSIVFLGEDNKGEGFYFISYNGGVKEDGTVNKTSHDLYVSRWKYTEFADMLEIYTLSIFDTNGTDKKAGGSYYAGTAKPAGDVRVANKKKRRITIACPVEAVVQYNGETLDSRSLTSENQIISTSFGTVTRDAENRIIFDLEPDIDYDLDIFGTDKGTMDLTLEYYDETGISDSRKFEKYPITESTTIQTSGFDPLAGFVLYGEDGSGEPTVWGAGIDETVTAETAQETSGFYSDSNLGPAAEIFLNVAFANGADAKYFVESPFTDSVKEAYVVAALYESSGKLREIVQQKVQDDGDEYNLSFKNALAESDYAKVLLFLDQSYKPLREARVYSLTADTE